MRKKTRSETSTARKPPRLSGSDGTAKPYTPSIALRSIDGHITRTSSTVTAWYRLQPQRWSFRTDEERWKLIQAMAGQYAEFQGRWLHIRVTGRPFPVAAWGEAHARNAYDPLPDTPGEQTFDAYLVGEQRQLQHRVMYDKEVYVGVEISRRTLVDGLIEWSRPVLRRVAPALLDAEVQALDSEIRHIDSVMAGSGLDGHPVTAEEMRWLVERSTNLGLPRSRVAGGVGTGSWASEDLAALTEGSTAWQEDPYAPTVTVRGRSGELADVERHVAVLTVGLMDTLHIPEVDDPWMHKPDGRGYPVEWSARIYVRPDQQVEHELTYQATKIRSQMSHYSDEHELAPPQDLARQAQLASDIEDEVSGQFGPQHARVKGWWRVAVSGTTREEALDRARDVVQHYKPKITLEHPEAQYHLRREFIPGEPRASQAYMRRGSVTWAASAVPTATASVGDRSGILLGETVGSARQPVAWDPWRAQEIHAQSGLTGLLAGLGGGKSFLGGGIVYKSVRAGARWVLLDPSGPLAQLCEVPELRPYARVINLLNAEPGILNPYRVVPEPQPEEYPDEAQWRWERGVAEANRRRLCRDVLLGVLPYKMAREKETEVVIRRAVRAVGGAATAHPGMVLDEIQRAARSDSDAEAVFEALDDVREQLRLVIPEPGADPYAHHRDDRLTVLTMPGLSLPETGSDPDQWSEAERLGAQLLSLAAWLTQRMVYSSSAHVRKGVWIDEAFFLSRTPTGAQLMDRFSRDSRKWNVRVLLSSQIPSDLTDIKGFASLIDSMFVGRLADEEAQSAALPLLGIHPHSGYEEVLDSLAPPRSTPQVDSDGHLVPDRTPRQFLFADGAGGVERIRVDFAGPHLAQLRQALETTPQPDTSPTGPSSRPPVQEDLEPDEPADDEADADEPVTNRLDPSPPATVTAIPAVADPAPHNGQPHGHIPGVSHEH